MTALKAYGNSNFIFISNLTENQEIKRCKSMDSETMEKLSMQKVIGSNTILNTFVYFSRSVYKKPEVVMYANSGDLDSNKKNTH